LCCSECDVIGQTAATSAGASGCLNRGSGGGGGGDGRAPVREVHRVTFAEDRNKYLNAAAAADYDDDDRLCDGLDFELGVRLAGGLRTSDDDDVELIPRHSIIKLPRPRRCALQPTVSPNVRHKLLNSRPKAPPRLEPPPDLLTCGF